MLRLVSTVCVAILLSGSCALAQSGLIEPNAGTTKTWVIFPARTFECPRHRTLRLPQSCAGEDLMAQTNADLISRGL